MRAVLFYLLVGAFTVAVSQKKKDKDQSQMDVTLLSQDASLKAESTLVEAEKHLILENYDKAYELFLLALKLNPSSAAVHFKVAEVLMKMGKNDEALSYAKKAVEIDSSNKYYHILVAEIYKTLGNYKAASAEFQYMIDHLKGTESYLFDLAIIYQFRGLYDSALMIYKRAEDVFGINEFVLREKQKIYLREKDYKSLMNDWDKLIALHPDELKYSVELCEFLIEEGLLEEAGKRLTQVLTDHPGSLEVSLLMCKIALKEGNKAEAMNIAEDILTKPALDYQSKLKLINSFLDFVITTEEFEVVKKLTCSLAGQYPHQYEVQAYAGDVLFRLEYKTEARDYYLKALKISPSNYGVWQNVLNIESAMAEFDSVIVHAEQALEYFPNQAILYYFAGTGYLIKKDFKKSANILEAGKKYASDPSLLTVFYGQLGDAYNSLSQHDKSDKCYEKALENNPENDHVLNNYSYFLSVRGQNLEKALEMSTRLIELHPDNPTYLDTHGWVLYMMKNYRESVKFLERAANLEEDGTVVEHYGDVLFQLGQVEEAVHQWEKASKLSDASENIHKKIADRKLYE